MGAFIKSLHSWAMSLPFYRRQGSAWKKVVKMFASLSKCTLFEPERMAGLRRERTANPN